MRKRFSKIFLDLLRSQLLLKNIVTPEDWEIMSEHIQFDFIYDNHFAELKDKELMEGRLGLLGMVEPYVGRYYSTEYIRRNVLRQKDAEIVEIDEQIEEEIANGVIPDPNQQMLEFEQGAMEIQWQKWVKKRLLLHRNHRICLKRMKERYKYLYQYKIL